MLLCSEFNLVRFEGSACKAHDVLGQVGDGGVAEVRGEVLALHGHGGDQLEPDLSKNVKWSLLALI